MNTLEVCNAALTQIGARRIGSLDENSEQAILLRQRFDSVRDAVNSYHPWSWATARAELSAHVDAPLFDYDYMYYLPADCLRVLDLNKGITSPKGATFRIETYDDQKVLLTDSGTAKIKYIAREEVIDKWSPLAQEALVARLAAEVCFKLVPDKDLKTTLITVAQGRLLEAKVGDVFEDETAESHATDEDGWLDARI